MAYTPQTWTNNDPATPLSASRLTNIEEGIEGAHDLAEADIPQSRVTGLAAALTAKADQTTVDGLLPIDQSDVTGLVAALTAITDRLDLLETE